MIFRSGVEGALLEMAEAVSEMVRLQNEIGRLKRMVNNTNAENDTRSYFVSSS